MRTRILLLSAVTSVLVAGCELQANVILDLEADGSGTVGVQLGLDDEFRELIESTGEDPEQALLEDGGPFGEIPGSTTRTYREGDFTYFEATAEFDNINAIGALVADDATNPISDLEIRVDEEVAFVSGSLDLGDVVDGADFGEFQGLDPSALTEFFGFHIQIKLPGELGSHNADRVLDDGTLEWDIPIFDPGATLVIQAESDLTGGGNGFPIWLLIVIAVVIALVVYGLYLANRSEKDRESALVGAATSDGADTAGAGAAEGEAAADNGDDGGRTDESAPQDPTA